MNKRIAFVSGKGGVGKSTMLAGIAVAFSALNKRTLIIDCDIGADSQKIIFNTKKDTLFNLGDLMTGRCDLNSVIIKSKSFNIDIISPPEKLDDIVFLSYFKKLLTELETLYDFILLDAPAGREAGYNMAITAAETAVIVATPDAPSISFAAKVAADANKRKKETRLIINKLKQGNKRKKPVDIDEYIDEVSAKLLGIVPFLDDQKLGTAEDIKKHRLPEYFINMSERLMGRYVKLSVSKKY